VGRKRQQETWFVISDKIVCLTTSLLSGKEVTVCEAHCRRIPWAYPCPIVSVHQGPLLRDGPRVQGGRGAHQVVRDDPDPDLDNME
jgi:hypothetical protein